MISWAIYFKSCQISASYGKGGIAYRQLKIAKYLFLLFALVFEVSSSTEQDFLLLEPSDGASKQQEVRAISQWYENTHGKKVQIRQITSLPELITQKTFSFVVALDFESCTKLVAQTNFKAVVCINLAHSNLQLAQLFAKKNNMPLFGIYREANPQLTFALTQFLKPQQPTLMLLGPRSSILYAELEKLNRKYSLAIQFRFIRRQDDPLYAIQHMLPESSWIITTHDDYLRSNISLTNMFLSIFRRNSVVIGHSEEMARLGALAALEPDATHYRRQVIQLLEQLIEGAKPQKTLQSPIYHKLFINFQVAKSMQYQNIDRGTLIAQLNDKFIDTELKVH